MHCSVAILRPLDNNFTHNDHLVNVSDQILTARIESNWLLRFFFQLLQPQENYLFIRYPIMRLAEPFEQPLLYIYDTRDTHTVVAYPHMHLDPYKRYYMNGTARTLVHIRVHYVCIPLKPANLQVGRPSHSTTPSLYSYITDTFLSQLKLAYDIQFCYSIQRILKTKYF